MFFVGCSSSNKQYFLHPFDEVTRVDIVRYYDPNGVGYSVQTQRQIEPVPEILYTLEEDQFDAIFAELDALTKRKTSMSPLELEDGYYGIMLTYRNGDYEILTGAAVFQHIHESNKNIRGTWYTVSYNGLNQIMEEYIDIK